jgi:hypothetical protein
MIRFLVAGAALVVALCSPAQAESIKDLKELADMIKASGTSIVFRNCAAGVQGYYSFQKGVTDELTICENNVDLKDQAAVWEVLAHEATHIMQHCYGGHVVAEEHHPRIIRQLKSQAPHYYSALTNYKGAHKMLEAEAFDMELQNPEHVKEWFAYYCLKQP